MNREDIIRMAREAGAIFPADGSYHRFESPEDLERFAQLVAEKERAEFAAHAVDIARRAIKEEREACAKIVEESSLPDAYSEPVLLDIAETIRARGEN